jgi:predicted restriction endonuclease
LTGCKIAKVLVASHAKKWAKSSNKERLDPYNGFLFAAHVDRLFDSGLISFDDNGRVLIGKGIDRTALTGLGLDGKKKLSFVREEHLKYLKAHRRFFGFKV